MNQFKKMLKLLALITVFGLVVGCGKKTPAIATTHHEFGRYSLIATEVYEECMANNDVQGAKDALETLKNLEAFCCGAVYYEDVKNRNYNNFQYNIGELQIAVAAYNEYNDESAMDIEVGWIRQFSTCTQEQHEAIEAYVEWYFTGQFVTADGLIRDYDNEFVSNYYKLKEKYDIKDAPSSRELTPAQFKEVQNYMADPENYQVNADLFE